MELGSSGYCAQISPVSTPSYAMGACEPFNTSGSTLNIDNLSSMLAEDSGIKEIETLFVKQDGIVIFSEFEKRPSLELILMQLMYGCFNPIRLQMRQEIPDSLSIAGT